MKLVLGVATAAAIFIGVWFCPNLGEQVGEHMIWVKKKKERERKKESEKKEKNSYFYLAYKMEKYEISKYTGCVKSRFIVVHM